jgi:NADPH:quinone reductase-like Zn-dependent oxidoreductase/pimeloyl-ACP methyl ester carboxylesterase
MIEKFYATTSGGQVHGRRVHGDGLPVVLLHRTPVSSAGFAAVLDYLARSGQAAVALDTPGFGESFMPATAPSAEDYGRWLLEAVDALRIGSFHLAAHHTGTHFAAEIAAAAPTRVASLTLSGIIIAPASERVALRADIGNAPSVDRDGSYLAETFKLMKSLFVDPVPELVHAETLGALVAGRGRDLAFDAIFAQDFESVLRRALATGRMRAQVVQAADDPLTLNGMLARFRDSFPQVPVRLTGPAFLAMPERQSGTFARAILDFTKEEKTMTDRRYELVREASGYALSRIEAATPAPGAGEVLVRVRAVSLNRRDLGVRDLSYPVNGADHFTPLSDAAGDVVAVGPGVTGWRVGDRVMSTFFQNHPGGRMTLPAVMSSLGAGGPGVFADHVILAETGLVAIPAGWTYQQAACVPCAGVTAWSALKTLGQLQAGDHVLVIGTGGVALFAIQIAAAAGARPIVLSSSNEKIERARALGAVSGINYRTIPDWPEQVRKMTNGAGVQHVIELGGVGTLQKSIASLGLGGHLALIGALEGFGGEMPVAPLIFAGLRVGAVMVGSRAEHQALVDFMVEHRLTPVIDQAFGFDEAEAAYQHCARGAFGKVVVNLTPTS